MKKLLLVLALVIMTLPVFSQSDFKQMVLLEKTIFLDTNTATTETVFRQGIIADSVSLIIQTFADTCYGSSSTVYAENKAANDSITVNVFFQPLTPDGRSDTTSKLVLGGTANTGTWLYCGQKGAPKGAYFSNSLSTRPSTYTAGNYWFKITNIDDTHRQRIRLKVWLVLRNYPTR